MFQLLLGLGVVVLGAVVSQRRPDPGDRTTGRRPSRVRSGLSRTGNVVGGIVLVLLGVVLALVGLVDLAAGRDG